MKKYNESILALRICKIDLQNNTLSFLIDGREVFVKWTGQVNPYFSNKTFLSFVLSPKMGAINDYDIQWLIRNLFGGLDLIRVEKKGGINKVNNDITIFVPIQYDYSIFINREELNKFLYEN